MPATNMDCLFATFLTDKFGSLRVNIFRGVCAAPSDDLDLRIIAALIGAYLGLLWIWTGNLLTPMVTHAVYDFVALVYFLRVYRSE